VQSLFVEWDEWLADKKFQSQWKKSLQFLGVNGLLAFAGKMEKRRKISASH
jgi:hypothetical protein